MTSATEFFSASLPVIDPLREDLIGLIRRKAAVHPRTLQRELGPSEVGHPCMRKMAFGLMEVPRCNPEYDPLPSVIGVAMHTWLQEAAEYDNRQLGWRRWIAETRVHVTPGLFGTADLYDVATATVIDWKNLGYTSFPAHVKDPGITYRNQVQMYGKGFANLGYPVKQVAIAMLPRTGTLSKMHLHREDYDESKADAALARRDAVIELLDELDVERNPERYQWIPNHPETCFFCPWWAPAPKSPIQCEGKA